MSNAEFKIVPSVVGGFKLVRREIRSPDGNVSEGTYSDLESLFRTIRKAYTGSYDAPVLEGGLAFRPERERLDSEIQRLRDWLLMIERVASEKGQRSLCHLAGEALKGYRAPEIPPNLPVRDLGVLPGVTVNIPDEIADRWDSAMSDLLCWAAGYNAALGSDQLDRRPYGVETVREIRETLNRSRRKAESAKS